MISIWLRTEERTMTKFFSLKNVAECSGNSFPYFDVLSIIEYILIVASYKACQPVKLENVCEAQMGHG